MNTLESNLLITLAMVIMIVLNLLFGLFSFYMIKEHETTLQRLLNTLYLLLAFVIQVRSKKELHDKNYEYFS